MSPPTKSVRVSADVCIRIFRFQSGQDVYLSGMKRLILASLVLVAASAAQGSCSLSSARFSAGLVAVGDSERRAIQSRPDRTVRLETREGGAAGFRLDYYRRGQTVQVYISAGRVVRICRIRE